MSRRSCKQTTSLPEGSPSRSSPIKATIFRRIITLCAISSLKRVGQRCGSVLFLTRGICVKYGEAVDLSEAASMGFIQRHTSVPVPKIFCAFKHKGVTYIVMTRIEGNMLAEGWTDRSEDSQARLLEQLKSMVQEIRSLKSPHGFSVASIDGGSLYDMRLPGLGILYPVPTARRFGPFEDTQAFHRWLRRPLVNIEQENPPEVNELVAMHENKDWGLPVFTHGDLSSFNILVQGETIVGIVDWERAGWYPSYWEYTTASQVNFRNQFWADFIDKFLEPRTEELKMEHIRMRYFGDNT